MHKHLSFPIQKLLRKLLAIGYGILLYNCDKPGPLPLVESWGTLTATVNGKEWSKTYKNAYQAINMVYWQSGTSVPCRTDFVCLSSLLYDSEMVLRQEFIFLKIPLSKGRYKVTALQPASCNQSDPVYASLQLLNADVLGASYGVLENEENYIDINEYNSDTKEVKGRFQVTVVFDNHGSTAFPSDTLRFMNGQFYTKIIR